MRVWRRSSRCDGGQCVDVRASDAGVQVRDGKNPDGPVLDITPTQWRFVLDWIRADEIPVGVATGSAGVVWNGLDGAGQPVSLGFTYEEWDAFVAGVKAGEFDRFQVSIEDVAGALAAAGDPLGAAAIREGARA